MKGESEVVLTRPKGGKKWIFLLVVTFIFVFLFLFYTSFINPEFGQTITGNVVKEDFSTGVSLQVDLGIPDSFSVDTKIDKMDMKIDGGFFIDDKGYELES